MRALASALIALSVLASVGAGVVAPASAFDAKAYFEQLERSLP